MRARWLLVPLLALAATPGCGRAAKPPASSSAVAPLLKGVVAAVGERTLSLEDLRRRARLEASRRSHRPATCAPVDRSCVEPAKVLVRRVLDDGVELLVARDHAARRAVQVAPDEIERVIADVARRAGVSKEELLAVAESQGLSAAEYRSFVEGALLLNQIWAAGPGKPPSNGEQGAGS